jgi:hypothetical protein
MPQIVVQSRRKKETPTVNPTRGEVAEKFKVKRFLFDDEIVGRAKS